MREERDRNPFDATRWVYDATGKLQGQEDSRTGGVDWPQDPAGNPLDGLTEGRVLHNRVTALNGIRWTYDIHGRTVAKVQGQQRWRYRYARQALRRTCGCRGSIRIGCEVIGRMRNEV